MADSEINVITHLLQVENDASSLVNESQAEADKRIAFARSQADSKYKTEYEQIIAKRDSEYNEKIKSIKELHKKTLQDYKTSIEQIPQNIEAFNLFLKKVLAQS